MIDLEPSAEQEQIVQSVRSLLSDRLPIERLRSEAGATSVAAEVSRDVEEWRHLGELGVFGLGLDAEIGGVGYSLLEEILVSREFGRGLLSPAALATMLAAHLAAAAHDAEKVTAIVSGDLPVAVAVRADDTKAGTPAGGFFLLDAKSAPLILLWDDRHLALAPAADFEDRGELAAVDSTVILERARLDAIPGSPRSDGSLARRGRLLASAYLAGIAQAALDDSVEYAKLREQFGQPIGSFQAVKHRCADMLARAGAAWNLTLFAGLCEASASPDAEFQSLAAKLIASEAASRNAAVNIQNHGGVGFTREHHAHLFVKRAHMLDLLGGSTVVLKKRLLAASPPLAAA